MGGPCVSGIDGRRIQALWRLQRDIGDRTTVDQCTYLGSDLLSLGWHCSENVLEAPRYVGGLDVGRVPVRHLLPDGTALGDVACDPFARCPVLPHLAARMLSMPEALGRLWRSLGIRSA